MSKIVTMGEIMLRLSTPNNEKFIQADEFDINYGGGEANVAVSLANYGQQIGRAHDIDGFVVWHSKSLYPKLIKIWEFQESI